MIQYTSEKQLMFEGFEAEFEKWIDPTNKWVALSHLVPWDEFSEAYGQTLSKNHGAPGQRWTSGHRSFNSQTLLPLQ